MGYKHTNFQPMPDIRLCEAFYQGYVMPFYIVVSRNGFPVLLIEAVGEVQESLRAFARSYSDQEITDDSSFEDVYTDIMMKARDAGEFISFMHQP